MLIRFNVKNFLSFDSMQEFSMIGGKVRRKSSHITDDRNIKLLKFAALYGANASGKSNLVHAISFAQRAIVHRLPKAHTAKYCKVDTANRQKDSYFEFEIKIGGAYYAYGFEIRLNTSRFTSEWLVRLMPNGIDKTIFSRDIEKGTYSIDTYFKNKRLKDRLDVYADDIKTDGSILFLKLMNQNKERFYLDNEEAAPLQDVFIWLKRKLDVNLADRPITNYSYFLSHEHEEINRIISAFGTGITDVHFKVVSPESELMNLPAEIVTDIREELEKKKADSEKVKKVPNQIMLRINNKDFIIFELDNDSELQAKTIQFNHGNDDILFSLSEESDGTARLLDLLEVLFHAHDEKVFVIDEIDRCLHPQLTYRFVETFLKLAAESDIQLIVTTHESRLLDFGLLRRDEVWFVDKDTEGASSLYSLEEYNTRFDQKIDKAYLEGRYGGVPIFNTIFPFKEDR